MNLGRILLRQSGLPLRLTYGCRLHRVRCLLLWEREILGEGRRWNRFGFHCSSVVDGLSHEPHNGSTTTVVQSASPTACERTHSQLPRAGAVRPLRTLLHTPTRKS